MRTLQFPADRSVGRLRQLIENDDIHPWRPIGSAQGTINIPIDTDVALVWLGGEDLTPLAALRADDLYRLELGVCPWLDDNTFGAVSHLTGLRELGVSSAPITDGVLIHLRQFSKLRSLGLPGTHIEGLGLIHLERAPLQRLLLDSTPFSDAGLAYIAGLPNLEDLDLSYTSISDAGLPHLRALSKLAILRVEGTQVTDAGVPQLTVLTALEWLFIEGTTITDEAVAALKHALPQCQVIG